MNNIIGIILLLVAAFFVFVVVACIFVRKEVEDSGSVIVISSILTIVCVCVGLNFLGVKIDLFSSNENNGTSYQTTDSSASSQEKHYCYVCGKECSYEYGGQYYCPTHGAMVKTVDEAQK